MPNTTLPTAFQDIAKSHQICIDISRWILDRVTHPGLGGKVHH